MIEPQNLANNPPVPGATHLPPTDWELYADGKIEGSHPDKLSPADQKWMQEAGFITAEQAAEAKKEKEKEKKLDENSSEYIYAQIELSVLHALMRMRSCGLCCCSLEEQLAKDKAEQHYISAGQHLKQLKDDCPDQKTFLEKVEGNRNRQVPHLRATSNRRWP